MKKERAAETLDPEAIRKIILAQWRAKKKAAPRPRKPKASA